MLSKQQQLLSQSIHRAIEQFPKTFDENLYKGFYQLIANTDKSFFDNRSFPHLQRILLSHYFLQKNMEEALENKKHIEKEVYLRIFSHGSHICVSIVLSHQREIDIFNERNILKAAQVFMSGVKEVPGSFLTWQSLQQSTLFCYVELQKIRGKDLSLNDLKELQKNLKKYFLHEVTSFCPTVFWPFNHEESFRQLVILQKEIHDATYPPQISIHFKEQTPSELEFLIHMARLKSKKPLEANIRRLPPSVRLISHINSSFKNKISTEVFAFSLCIPTHHLDMHQGVNLLQARKYITMLLEEILGSFRDFNGGLFTVQENRFAKFKAELSHKIPDFSLFAEALLYSLKPVKRQTALDIQQVESLFTTFSSVMREKKPFYFLHHPSGTLVLKTKDASFLEPMLQKFQHLQDVTYGYLQFSGMHYLAILDPSKNHTLEIERRLLESQVQTEKRTLRLAFQVGLPPSLNPHFLASGFRCYSVFKALFEGLTRLDNRGNAVLAGAKEMSVSEDGLSFTFILRPNHWSNGVQVTASHYVERWKQVFKLEDQADAHNFLFIKNGKKILEGVCSPDDLAVFAHDGNTLEIQLQNPDPFLLHRLSEPIFSPNYDLRMEPSVFNGPYSLYHRSEKNVVLERNPYFWNRKEIFFDTIEIAFIPCPIESHKLFEKGFLEWTGSPFHAMTKDIVTQLETRKKLRKKTFSRVLWLHLNTEHPLLKSQWIRKALHLALDRKEIHQKFLVGVPRFSPLPKNLSPRSDFSLKTNKKDAQKALALGLEETDIIKKSLPPLQLLHLDNPRFQALAEYLQHAWQKTLGITIVLQKIDWNGFLNSLEKGEFHIGGCYEGPQYPHPLSILEKFEFLSSSNFSRWTHPPFQEKITLIRSSQYENEKIQLINEAEDILMAQTPVISISNEVQVYDHHPSLKGYIFNCEGSVDFSYSYLKLPKDK